LQLAAAGCDVIVDDIIYYAEPMFQDGIIAQAVDQVVAQGIPFFSAADNEARKSWIAPTGFNPVTIFNKVYHRFGTNSNGSPITIMRISMQGSSELRTFVVLWDETFASVCGPPGSRSYLDFVLRIGSFFFIRNANNIGVDPVEIFHFFPFDSSTNATVTAELTIESYSGPLPTYMKLVVFGQVTSFEFDTKSSTSYGHPNAAQGAGVGAARYSSTPAFGISPPIVESFLPPEELRFCLPRLVLAFRVRKFTTNPDLLVPMVVPQHFLEVSAVEFIASLGHRQPRRTLRRLRP
jgi:hypothetical protein